MELKIRSIEEQCLDELEYLANTDDEEEYHIFDLTYKVLGRVILDYINNLKLQIEDNNNHIEALKDIVQEWKDRYYELEEEMKERD